MFRTRFILGVAVVTASLATGCSVDDRLLMLGSADASVADAPELMPRDGGGEGGGAGGGGRRGSGGASGGAPDEVDGSDARPPTDGGGCFHQTAGELDCDDTLVENADFNATTGHWKMADALGEIAWAPEDSQGSSRSGSLLLQNTHVSELDGPVTTFVEQCIPCTPDTTYEFQAEVLIENGQPAIGAYGGLAVWFYENERCGGIPASAYGVKSTDVTGHWAPIKGRLLALPTHESMSVRLTVQKPFRAEPFEIHFDAVRVRVAP